MFFCLEFNIFERQQVNPDLRMGCASRFENVKMEREVVVIWQYERKKENSWLVGPQLPSIFGISVLFGPHFFVFFYNFTIKRRKKNFTTEFKAFFQIDFSTFWPLFDLNLTNSIFFSSFQTSFLNCRNVNPFRFRDLRALLR